MAIGAPFMACQDAPDCLCSILRLGMHGSFSEQSLQFVDCLSRDNRAVSS